MIRPALSALASRLRAEQGMTLPELLVAMVVSLLVFGAATEAFAGFLRGFTRTDRQTQAQDTARTAIDRMAVQLRSAMSTGGSGEQPIVQRSSYDLVFLVPTANASLTNNPRGLMWVRYCLDAANVNDEKLWVQTNAYDSVTRATPPLTASCPSSAWSAKDMAAGNLVNQLQAPAKPLFTTPTDASGNVTDVGVHAVVDVDTVRAPPATELQSKVTLRNLNRPPVSALSCSAQNGVATCDASASTDPDGQNLTFKWEMNALPLTETSYRLQQTGLVGGVTYTFKVIVTDSGGISSSATQNLAMPLL